MTWWEKSHKITHGVFTLGMTKKSALSEKAWMRVPWKERSLEPSFGLPVIGNKTTDVVNTGWEEILALKNFDVSKTWKINCAVLLNVVISISKPTEKSSQYHTCSTTLMQNCLSYWKWAQNKYVYFDKHTLLYNGINHLPKYLICGPPLLIINTHKQSINHSVATKRRRHGTLIWHINSNTMC